MEEKINVAEILKDKPQGTKLYDLLYNIDVELDTISTTDTETVAWCTNETDNNTTCHRGYSEFGTVRGCTDGLQILLPSKEMRDWSKFFKKGDVLVSKGDNTLHVIFEGFVDDTYITFKGKHFLCDYDDNEDYNEEEYNDYQKEVSLRTIEFDKDKEDDAQIYIKTIEERLGGKLNRGTLEIEKTQPEFKDGDIVFVESHMLGINTSSMITAIFRKEKENDKYKFSPALCESNVHDTYLRESPVVLSPSDIKTFRLATDSEKQQLFDALAKYEKAWDAEKKEVVGLKPKVELKPFDKVLVRDSKSDTWRANLFGYIDKDGYYRCVYANWVYCIPYIDNESLLGTTKDVEG